MIRKKLIPICIVLAAGVIWAPISAKGAGVTQVTNYVSQQPEVYNKVNFQVITYNDAPDALTKAIDTYKNTEGFVYYLDSTSNNLYVAVMSGEKPTGGYSIKVDSVEDANGKANILVEETKPDKNSLVNQMVTYPYTIIKTQVSSPNISVKNSSGKVYDLLGAKKDDDNPIIGSSFILGQLKNIYTTNDFIFLEIQNESNESELFYVNNNDQWKNKIKDLKLNSNVSVQYALGTPQKYNEKSAFPLSKINLPVDINWLKDKNWQDLKNYSNVSQNKQWKICFNQQLKEQNVNGSNVYVTDSNGNIIPTAVRLLEDKKSISITPYKPYELGQNYYIFITNKINGTDNSSFKGFRMNFQIMDSFTIK
ncbi:hypothetical protein Ccar_10050 [Clostridium carboxidivorans P7]|uniref:PrcB C-terminal domain-containing protein n=1 Tax=Clostridium carboxidivorans P7 TaxID=536227 RepID=C6PY59_9CLOT|nr:protease complex subunit PrcB family protein [Clostridium carboxidivorans]AKN31172.1 hypothetical protein Ccar_10050 [Clostridium carboxidivorans P7]EET85847.1 hypothetical protein CcarbDRAFT_3726 [Clostridium carboxidivorans P7]EFG88285.1 hypothetical protein CLCAR_1859 [Clostridium carboxidivorans P7]